VHRRIQRIQFGEDLVGGRGPDERLGVVVVFGDVAVDRGLEVESSHVLPALIRKAHEAKISGAASMKIWGSGTPRREFLHVDDCADALVYLMKVYSDESHVNVGSGTDVTIDELASMVMEVVGFDGKLTKDTTKPDGTPQKLMNCAKLAALGWRPSIGLKEGIASVYDWARPMLSTAA
jgi:GDP-L-fucose synthase